jgi:hypothetical protein
MSTNTAHKRTVHLILDASLFLVTGALEKLEQHA